MLATILAAHLLLAQAPALAQATPPGDDNPYEQPPTNPPLPSKPQPQRGAPNPASQPAPPPAAVPPATGGTAPSQPASPSQKTPTQISLLSAEPLAGNAAALAWAGWSSLGIAYGMGVTPRDDIGGAFDFDWAKTELRLGAFYRRPLVGTAGPFDMAGRLGLAWYHDFGGGWIYGANHSAGGLELAPALVLSTRASGGIFSLSGEFPLTITWSGGGGLLFIPRAAASYEAPLYDELTLGVRAALGYRAGAGDAPLSNGRADVQFLVLAGYRAL